MTTPHRIALALLAALPLLAGCTAKPQIHVQRAAWTGERSEEAAVLSIDIDVLNPGRVPMELREMRYLVWLDGRRVYSGRRSTAQTIAPGDVFSLTVPAVVPVNDLDSAEDVSMAGSLGFITPGRITLVMRDLGLPPFRRDFTGEAALDGAGF